MSGCEACRRGLYFSERVAWPQFLCFPCSTLYGVIRLADWRRLRNLRSDAAALPAWWRWTRYLEHALRWDDSIQATLGRDFGHRGVS